MIFFAYLNWKTDLTSFHSLMLNVSKIYIYRNNNNLISLYHHFMEFHGGISYKFQYAFMWIWIIMHIYMLAGTFTGSTARTRCSNNIMENQWHFKKAVMVNLLHRLNTVQTVTFPIAIFPMKRPLLTLRWELCHGFIIVMWTLKIQQNITTV